MRYSLGHKERPCDRVGPVAADQLTRAASELNPDDRPPHNGESNKAVHRTRVAVKKARAALRLVEHADPAAAARAHQHLREISHALSGTRDHDAVLELVAWLLEHEARTNPERRALRSLADAHRRTEDPSPDELARLSQELEQEAERIERLISESASPETLTRGFRRSTLRAARAMRRFRKHPGVRTLHRWRRRTKDHLFQCVLVQELAGRRLRRRVSRLKKLASTLGTLHDVALVGAFPDARLGADPATTRFVVARAHASLWRKARREGARLFGPKAERAVRRVGKRLGNEA